MVGVAKSLRGREAPHEQRSRHGGHARHGTDLYEANEPVFHETWEGRVYALIGATGRWGRGRWRGFRTSRTVPAAEYLRIVITTWFYVLVDRLVRTGLVSRKELESGKADRQRRAQIRSSPAVRSGARRAERSNPRATRPATFRVRNMDPRLHWPPRYARGKRGTILAITASELQDGHRSVPIGGPQTFTRSASRAELWGDQVSPRDNVYVDMWEHYLERD